MARITSFGWRMAHAPVSPRLDMKWCGSYRKRSHFTWRQFQVGREENPRILLPLEFGMALPHGVNLVLLAARRRARCRDFFPSARMGVSIFRCLNVPTWVIHRSLSNSSTEKSVDSSNVSPRINLLLSDMLIDSSTDLRPGASSECHG